MISRRSAVALLAATVLLPFAGRVQAADAIPFDAKIFAAAQDKGGPILVEIHASWCGTCKIQKVIIDDLMKSADLAPLNIFRVDFDGQKEAVSAFGADTQSTLIVYRGKTELARSVGETSGKAIEALLRKAI